MGGIVTPFIFDSIVFFLTVKKTLGVATQLRNMRLKFGLTELLLRDGAYVFAASAHITHAIDGQGLSTTCMYTPTYQHVNPAIQSD